MTERKPPGVTFETWIDKQIREATERGDFAGLPGAGKPLPHLDQPYDEMWWIKDKMQPGAPLLPAADASPCARRRRTPWRPRRSAPTEAALRRILTAVNERIERGAPHPARRPAAEPRTVRHRRGGR